MIVNVLERVVFTCRYANWFQCLVFDRMTKQQKTKRKKMMRKAATKARPCLARGAANQSRRWGGRHAASPVASPRCPRSKSSSTNARGLAVWVCLQCLLSGHFFLFFSRVVYTLWCLSWGGLGLLLQEVSQLLGVIEGFPNVVWPFYK